MDFKTQPNQQSSPTQVYVRWKPPSSSEQSTEEPVFSIEQGENNHSVSISSRSDSNWSKKWGSKVSFTQIFSTTARNNDVYESVVQPSLAQVMEGATCNVFAYGHSGSGKTHTIIGYEYNDDQDLGLCLSAARDLFRAITEEEGTKSLREPDGEHADDELGVAIRLYEVRGKSAFDLLNEGNECHVRQGPDGRTHIRGQTEMLEGGKVRVRPIAARPFWSFHELKQAMLDGLALRKTGSSSIHEQSSRTHAFVELEVINKSLMEARDLVIERESELVPVGKLATDVYLEEHTKSFSYTDDGKYVPNPDHPLDQVRIDAAEAEKQKYEVRLKLAEEALTEHLRVRHHRCLGGKFVFVDLAGSEYFDHPNGTQAVVTKQTSQERQQGRQINTDLFALKEVIRARSSGKARIPFRSSPLTMMLRSHFMAMDGGQSSMILTASTLESQFAATKNTLNYGMLVSLAGGN